MNERHRAVLPPAAAGHLHPDSYRALKNSPPSLKLLPLHGLHSKPTTTTLPGLAPETGAVAPIASPYSVSPSPFLDPLLKSSSVRSLYLNLHCHGFSLASHDPRLQFCGRVQPARIRVPQPPRPLSALSQKQPSTHRSGAGYSPA